MAFLRTKRLKKSCAELRNFMNSFHSATVFFFLLLFFKDLFASSEEQQEWAELVSL